MYYVSTPRAIIQFSLPFVTSLWLCDVIWHGGYHSDLALTVLHIESWRWQQLNYWHGFWQNYRQNKKIRHGISITFQEDVKCSMEISKRFRFVKTVILSCTWIGMVSHWQYLMAWNRMYIKHQIHVSYVTFKCQIGYSIYLLINIADSAL